MTDKELRRLSRIDLLELLIQQADEHEKLRSQLSIYEAQIASMTEQINALIARNGASDADAVNAGQESSAEAQSPEAKKEPAQAQVPEVKEEPAEAETPEVKEEPAQAVAVEAKEEPAQADAVEAKEEPAQAETVEVKAEPAQADAAEVKEEPSAEEAAPEKSEESSEMILDYEPLDNPAPGEPLSEPIPQPVRKERSGKSSLEFDYEVQEGINSEFDVE